MSQQTNKTKVEHSAFRERLYEIIFEADTPEGKLFDVALLGAILLSVIVVMLETVPQIQEKYGILFMPWNGYSQSSLLLNTSYGFIRSIVHVDIYYLSMVLLIFSRYCPPI